MKKIIINDKPWQTRIGIIRDGELENVYFSAHAQTTLERLFFKGIVSKVLPGIQTAFVNIGQKKAGFLHISEIDRDMALKKISKNIQLDDQEEIVEPKTPHQQKDISKILKEGDSILVQVSKEPVYEKGAKLTTCFTLPGRYIVLMPNIPRIGVSKKIEDRDERTRLKTIVRAHLPETMGAIIRTTCEGTSEQAIAKDIRFLLKTWYAIEKEYQSAEPQAKLHEDLPISLQVVRDHLDDNVEAVITDNKETQNSIYQFVKEMAPEHSTKVKLYTDSQGIFDYYGIEKQIQEALNKKVELKSGGSLIIETTEAMTVVDVNTGKFIGKKSMEDTILKTNMEAAQEVVRQLRLRNIGGLIVIDFIDLALAANRQKLFKHFEKTLKEQDRYQSVVLKLSEFGIVQMTRKRSGKTLQQQLTINCMTCHGYGFVKSLQTQCYSIFTDLRTDLASGEYGKIVTVKMHPDMFEYITATEYNTILNFEKIFGIKITLASDKNRRLDEYKIEKR
jgi:ribonuclease G